MIMPNESVILFFVLCAAVVMDVLVIVKAAVPLSTISADKRFRNGHACARTSRWRGRSQTSPSAIPG